MPDMQSHKKSQKNLKNDPSKVLDIGNEENLKRWVGLVGIRIPALAISPNLKFFVLY